MSSKISIKGAKVHNLKNINIDIPKNKLVVITGLSGSGKSSLAFDTIYAEGQHRYAESLSAYARQFMDVRKKPDVEKIEGLSPTIAINQKVYNQNPRSTVGTATEIYDHLRLLYTRLGVQYCPSCNNKIYSQSNGQIIEQVKKIFKNHKKLQIFAPIIQNKSVHNGKLLERIERSGFDTIRVNGDIYKIHDLANFKFDNDKKYTVELLVAIVNNLKKQNISYLVDKALELSNGLIKITTKKEELLFSTTNYCHVCYQTIDKVDVRSLSFNSPKGACSRCSGLGVAMEVVPKLIIPNKKLTIAEGAIQPWTRLAGRQTKNNKILQVISEALNFSLDVPIKDLDQSIVDILLNGTGDQLFLIDGKKVKFDGIIKQLREKYLTTDSDYIRKELENFMRESICPVCNGLRLKQESLNVLINKKNISNIAQLSIDELKLFLDKIISKNKNKKIIIQAIVKELKQKIDSLKKVGLGYLTSDRPMNTLSGGEVTRVRLATQLTTGLNGVIYVLDEPSVGLHPRDIKQLIDSLKKLRDLGNTVIVVEHDAEMMNKADFLVDVGPGAGLNGGQIVAKGTLTQIKKSKNSLTGEYLNKKLGKIKMSQSVIARRSFFNDNQISIIGAKANNLKNIDVAIPLQKLVSITGVSGSGKSTLVIDVLGKALSQHFHRSLVQPGLHKEIKGLKNIDKVIAIDQSPIGRTPRSNPATYTNLFSGIRDLYANLQESKVNNYKAGKFSFNVKGGGRCETCAGEGYIKIPMQFLSDVYLECSDCGGTRYSSDVLEVHYKGKNISEVLSMTVDEAWLFFNNISNVIDKLSVLREVGLGYLELGQSATTLSGGEAQRIKLATELARASTGRTLYILDEPTTGLHSVDVNKLMKVLRRLVDKGNTVLIIEHNIEVINSSDWVIDMGPEGGNKGGKVVDSGTPEQIKKAKKSWTGKYL